jgi:hypothetical protein
VRRGRLWRVWQLLLLLALAWFPAGRVAAVSPPPPSGQQPLPTLAPVGPAAGQAVLYDQFDSPSSSWVISQDSTNPQYDTRAADDFFAASGLSSWEINAIEVVGFYSSGSGPKTVSSVNIDFYADAAGSPGYRLFTRSSVPTGGTDSTGNFNLPLAPVVALASNANYWVSVQAVQSTPWFWGWSQRTPQSQSPAVWQNPNGGFGTGCTTRAVINIACFPDSGNDMLFRLYGTQSASQLTPILLSLSPNRAAFRSFTLNADGAGFADGAKLNWTLGPTTQFDTTFSNAGRVSAVIPASAVSSYGATVSVSVTNPGPCAGSCTSNTLTFSVTGPVLLPVVRR